MCEDHRSSQKRFIQSQTERAAQTRCQRRSCAGDSGDRAALSLSQRINSETSLWPHTLAVELSEFTLI